VRARAEMGVGNGVVDGVEGGVFAAKHDLGGGAGAGFDKVGEVLAVFGGGEFVGGGEAGTAM